MDDWALGKDDVAILLDSDGLGVLAVSVGDVERLDNSGPWVTENGVLSLNGLDTAVIECSDFLGDISGTVGSSEDLDKLAVSDALNSGDLELNSLGGSNKIGNSGSD